MDERIREFAELLVRHVRDASIASCDILLDAESNAFAKMLIADCVDDAIFHLLHAIDDGVLPVGFKGSDLGQEGGGELAGFYMRSEGWRKEFSQERYIDDFKDL